MSELPTPAGLGNKEFKLDGGIKVSAVQFEEREFGKHIVEFGRKGNQLVFHFFKDGIFPLSFRGRIYGALTRNFGFNGKESELLDITWVEEFNSWCAIIKNVLELAPPPSDSDIEEAIKHVFS